MPGQRYISDGQKAKRYLPNEKSSACGAWQRRLTVLFAAAVLSALPAAALGVGAATTATTTSALNVRSGTGTSYSVLKVLSKSSEVTVLDTTSNTSWYKVLLSDGTTGYCSSKYLNLTGTMTTTTALNLRKGASTSYSIITTMSKGTSVTVLSSSNGWARVKTSSGTIGYCSLQYLAADTSVTLSSSSVSLTVGGTKTLTADTTVTWSSSDTSVVTVSSSGKLTAIKAGTATITATSSSGATATCKVTVTASSASSSSSSTTFSAGDTAETTAALNLRKGAGTAYSIITTMSKGTEVTVISTKGNWAYVKTSSGTLGYCSMSYLSLVSSASTTVTLSSSSVSLTVGSTKTLTADTTVTWSSSDTSVVTVSSSGKLTAVKAGTATITATSSSGATATCKVTVTAASSSSSSSSTTTIKTGDIVKTTAALNLRKGAGTAYSIIKTLSKGTNVTVLSTKSNWAYVQTSDGTLGYCSMSYLSLVDSVTLSSSSVKITVGNTKTLTADTTVTWSSSDTSVVTVSSGGKLTAVSEGTATVTATSSTGAYAECEVTVKGEVVTVENSYSLALGGTRTLSCDDVATWTSDDESIVKVDSSGNLTAVSTGTAYISAYDDEGNLLMHSKITVVDKGFTSITINSTVTSLKVGESFNLEATTNTGDGDIYYRSRNSSVATVDSDGNVTAVASGTAVLVAYDHTATIKATLTITVTEDCTITMTKTTASVSVGSSVTLSASASDGSTVQWSSSDESIASVKDGVVSGFKAGTVTITASSADGTSTKTCKVTVTSVSSSSVSISNSSASLCVGQKLYLTGSVSSGSVSWTTSNSSIATVSGGYVYAKSAGKVAISVKDSSGHVAVCVVTVEEAEPIQFSYSSSNSATLNSTVTLVAITDTDRDQVKFQIQVGNTVKEVTATSKTKDGDTYVWKATYKATTAGTFTVTAYSTLTGSSTWETCDSGTSTMFVSEKTSSTETAVEALRASDELIAFIAEYEGFTSSVTADTLANNVPTIGYGLVLYAGDTFYDDLTEAQAYALLVKTINEGVYTTKVNNFLVSNNVAFNQQQFDALVSFSYNLGTGWISSSDLKDILLSAVSTSTTETLTATVNASSGLNLRKSPTTSSSVIEVLPYGTTVTLVSATKYNSVWYKVTTSDGTTGYCSSTYLTLQTTSSTQKDLNYVNTNALITEVLAYHHAGGVCYYGLLYRRADELEMFLYGDYVVDGKSNKYNFPDPSCISWP